MKEEVAIVGAGPSGLATAACLNLLAIPNIVLEKEDCCGSLWRRRTYDRLKLHLPKQFCALPHMPHHSSVHNFIPKEAFIRYLEDYAACFEVNAVYNTEVESAAYDEAASSWRITAHSRTTGEAQEYMARFLVVASGENSEGFVPEIPGLDSFEGDALHSSMYKSGAAYAGKRVLVVGSGNSGMEIAYDLSNYGAKTSVSIRSQLHVMTKESIFLGMVLMKYLPIKLVDALLIMISHFNYGNLAKYGIVRPKMGPMTLKSTTGRSAVIDVGTVAKIKTGGIQVVKEPERVQGNEIIFSDGKSYHFDAIVFATGYKSTANAWLKDRYFMLNNNGFPSRSYPEHWKGRNGLYCAGLSRRGLAGASTDAQDIANDIRMIYCGNQAP